MSVELGILFAAIACIIGILTFFGGRHSAAKNEGEQKGWIKTSLENITVDIKEIKSDLRASTLDTMSAVRREEESRRAAIQKEEDDRREADRRLHARIDEHVSNFHSVKGNEV